MLKSFTLGLGLAVALVASGSALAGGHGKSLPSAQGPVVSAQSVVPSAQSCDVGPACGPVAKCNLFSGLGHIKMPKICLPKFNHNYTYTWVLKKKRCGPLLTWDKGHAGGCDGCGAGGAVYPTAQYASAQAGAYGSGQAGSYGSGQIYGAGQATHGEMAPQAPLAPEGMEAPPAPAPEAPAPSVGSLLFPGSPAGN